MSDLEAAQRAAVVAEARSWLGTPYHHLADLKGIGVDCAMLLVRIYVDTGVVPALDPRPYPPNWHMHRSEERYLAGLDKVIGHHRRVEAPQPGDCVLFRFGRCHSHSGIVVDWPGQVIHAYYGEGCILGDASKVPLDGREPIFYSPWSAP